MTSYVNEETFRHGEIPATGVLLANLGTPDAPTSSALRRYLREFLSDPRVIELPRWKWYPILYLFVLTFRPRKSAALYQEVWTEEGSPLLVIARKQLEGIRKLVEPRSGGAVHFALGMRYGNPSIGQALNELREKGCRRLLVLPLYPQYSASTTASTFDAVTQELCNWRWVPEMRFINSYHEDPAHIRSLAASIREVWNEGGEPEKLLFSFHGIPQRYLDGGDPYHCICHKTARLVVEELGLDPDRAVVSFQSLFGREEWIKPYTEDTVRALGKSGVRSLDIICPGFSADCLETLEEIDGENREVFLEAGGKEFRYIPALNDRPDHLQGLADLVLRHMGGWLVEPDSWDQAAVEKAAAASCKRAEAMAANPPVADGGFG